MKKMSKKGFTLIELLAVIVILGLLMAIAIPSVTKYIIQSRKKTLVSTIDNYIQAVSVDVNNGEYDFTDGKIYAVPINCVSLEKGGKDPFGKWNGFGDDGWDSWAYVLVQHDGNDSYIYGFTFKDTAGYGMYPKAVNKIESNGNDISNVGDNMSSPDYYEAASYYSETWEGFKYVSDEDNVTKLLVLTADSTQNKTVVNGETIAYTCVKVQK